MASKPQREANSAELRATLDELETQIEALRLAYEKYFAGIERIAPTKQRAKLERFLRNVETRGITNTVIRFRLNGLRARLVTYKHYWTRVENELERGTSRRDRMKKRRLEANAASESAGSGPPPPPPPDARARGPEPDPASAGLDPAHLRTVFKQLVQAKRAAGESTKGLTYQALVRKLTAEAPKLQRKHGCEKLQFSVSTRDGKVKLRSEPGG